MLVTTPSTPFEKCSKNSVKITISARYCTAWIALKIESKIAGVVELWANLCPRNVVGWGAPSSLVLATPSPSRLCCSLQKGLYGLNMQVPGQRRRIGGLCGWFFICGSGSIGGCFDSIARPSRASFSEPYPADVTVRLRCASVGAKEGIGEPL
jgi:hypothetical protein